MIVNNIIKWMDEGVSLSSDIITAIEKKLGILFPPLFKEIIRFHNGGTPQKDSFYYFDEFLFRKTGSGIGGFIPLVHDQYSSIESLAFSPPEFFPEGLIAFAETGGGDFICFDYRQGKDNSDPPIVYWSHGADIGKDVSFLAKNFEEFLKMLEESEEE